MFTAKGWFDLLLREKEEEKNKKVNSVSVQPQKHFSRLFFEKEVEKINLRPLDIFWRKNRVSRVSPSRQAAPFPGLPAAGWTLAAGSKPSLPSSPFGNFFGMFSSVFRFLALINVLDEAQSPCCQDGKELQM